MTTATIAPVTVTTLDGESREAQTCPDGSWSCPFCSGANFPLGHEHHREYGWAGPCMNPGCVVGGNMTEAGTASYRESERRRQERADRDAQWKREHEERELMAQLEREAAEAKRQRATEQRKVTREMGEQLGFAWHCFAGECEHNGTDRAEWVAHQRGHGVKAPAPAFKPVRLRKRAPAATLPKLEVNPFKWARWTQHHTEPGICECGHASTEHATWHGNDGITVKCGECSCVPGPYGMPKPTEYSAERRGQYLANGPAPHSVWVIPFERAPWEDGTAEPVLLYVGKAGRYFADAWRAKSDRR